MTSDSVETLTVDSESDHTIQGGPNMKKKLTGLAIIAALAMLGLTYASAGAPLAISPSCGLVLDAEVCVSAIMDGTSVRELSVTVPLRLIEAAPAEVEMSWPPEELAAIALPDDVRAALGIDHLGINWEAHGHPPGPFLTPHFDFHFYNVGRDELATLDCTDESKPTSIPPGYMLPDINAPGLGMLLGLCVPRMGMHAMPENEVEAAEPFRATMVMGYYGGAPIFFEPMVSRARLLERSDFALTVPSVSTLPAGVLYPSEFVAVYEAAADQYRFVMTGFDGR